MVKIFDANDRTQSELLKGMLDERGIQNYCRRPGNEQYLNMTAGCSVYGEEIFVSKGDEQEARKMIKASFLKQTSEMEREGQGPTLRHQKRNRVPKILLGLLFGIVLVSFLTGLVQKLLIL